MDNMLRELEFGRFILTGFLLLFILIFICSCGLRSLDKRLDKIDKQLVLQQKTDNLHIITIRKLASEIDAERRRHGR
jgi:Na+/pantothenate symporter